MIAGLLVILGCAAPLRAADAPSLLVTAPGEADVSLVAADHLVDVFVDANDHAVVRLSADLLTQDIQRVTGRQPSLKTDAASLGSTAILVGTIGQSPVIDRLIADGKLDIAKVGGQWETFVIATVEHPLPNVDRALVIAGSDRRGTAFGVFELSEQIGVSPWYWWSDVPATKRDAITIKAGTHVVGPPRVKYRGFFINDEDWGLTPWASKTFEPEVGNIGPKTYAKVFELMLRLKTNYLWPAMHHCTTEFAAVPDNVEAADQWGIVMGASHPEPMLRNNVWFDERKRGPWRYDTNRDNIIAYWEESARDRGKYEAVWTVGMRGIHDSGMNGPRDLASRTSLLAQAIDDQRNLLSRYVNSEVAKVPQAFVPYKEVLEQYQAGLKLADDITLVWPDDNYGYIRQLSTPDEQKRGGRAGVYYHISYLGRPMPYLWVNTTPPALIWQQMQTALAHGADGIWVLNVGDIKPGEIGMDFWSRLAWNPDRWSGPDVQTQFLTEWAAREFGTEASPRIAELLNRYYQLGAQRKPELMGPGAFANADEAGERTRAMEMLARDAEQIASSLSAEQRDAFTELLAYPVHVAADTNLAFLYSDAGKRAEMQGRLGAAAAYARATHESLQSIEVRTEAFNNTVAGGKWKHMMKQSGFDVIGERTGWGDDWLVRYDLAAKNASANGNTAEKVAPQLGVLIEGRARSLVAGKAFTPTETPGSSVDLSVVENDLQSPWQLTGDGEARVAGVPNGTAGDRRDVEKSTPLTFPFEMKFAGRYNLFGDVIVPTADDDSFFIRIDAGPWKTWNDIRRTGAMPEWREQGGYDLSAGPHTLEIAPREDGAFIRRLRLTRRHSAEPPAFPKDDRPVDLLTLASAPGYSSARVRAFRTDASPIEGVQASSDVPWIKIDSEADPFGTGEHTYRVSVDEAKLPAEKSDLSGEITLTAMDESQSIRVRYVDLPSYAAGEVDGVVSIEAERPTRTLPAGNVAWRKVPNLGRTGDGAVVVFPSNAPSVELPAAGTSACMEYDIVTTSANPEATLSAYCLPTYRLHAGRGLRYGVSIDDGPIQVVEFAEDGGGSGEHGEAWNQRKRRNVAITQSRLALRQAGRHTLKLWLVDPNVVIDKLVLDLGGFREGEVGPPETRRALPAASTAR